MYEAPAFVLGLGANGYGIVRSLVTEGIPVVGIYHNPEEYGRYTKYCAAHYMDPRITDDEKCNTLIELASQWPSRAVLFVTADVQAMFVAKNGDRLARHFLFHWVPSESLTTIVNKSDMVEWCNRSGVLTPRTHVTQYGENIAEVAREFSYPCLVKPMRSFNTRFPPMKNFVAKSSEELCGFYATHSGLAGTTIWQQIIEGNDDDVYQCNMLVTSSGEFQGVCCVRKIHQFPGSFGHMSFGGSVESIDLVTQCKQILERLNFRGLASIEFKRDSNTGRLFFIEMNPRLPWYNSLFPVCGVNLALLAYLDLIGAPVKNPELINPKLGVFWFCLADELRRFSEPGGSRRILEFLKKLHKVRAFAWWNPRDTAPFNRYFRRILLDIFGLDQSQPNRTDLHRSNGSKRTPANCESKRR